MNAYNLKLWLFSTTKGMDNVFLEYRYLNHINIKIKTNKNVKDFFLVNHKICHRKEININMTLNTQKTVFVDDFVNMGKFKHSFIVDIMLYYVRVSIQR